MKIGTIILFLGCDQIRLAIECGGARICRSSLRFICIAVGLSFKKFK